MATVAETKELLDRALELGLSGAEHCAKVPIETLAANYNGAGPDWFPDWARKLLTKCFPTFGPIFPIHDQRFSESNGTTQGFNFANDEIEVNGIICADARYGRFNPFRYIARHRARRVANACRLCGWSAWMDGYKKRMAQKKTISVG